MIDTIVSGRDALSRGAWDEAVQAFTAADRQRSLAPDDLRMLADALWWSGRPDEAVEVFERAYTEFERADDHTSAAMVALRLTEMAMRRMAFSVGGGWMAQAERLLASAPESPAHAWLAFVRTADALHGQRDPEAAMRQADEAIAISQRVGAADVRALAQAFKGSAMLLAGQVTEGLALIDEASASATSGEIDLRSACNVYCHTIAACRDLGDYRRAGEWTEQAERFMERRSIHGYPGICRVHRAELKRLRGSWPEAEVEARYACDELERFRLLDGVGMAHYEIGEVRLHLGDLDAAEDAFLRAFEYGRDPQPGMALLQLARGEQKEAASSIARALADVSRPDVPGTTDPLIRGRLLPAQVEIALAGGDLDTARSAADEMEAIAEQHARPVWEASALACRGAVLLYEGAYQEAVATLNRAWRLWRDIELPYDEARTRMLLGEARAAAGDANRARLEYRAARSAFERLGAVIDLARVDDLLGDEEPITGSGRERVTKAFMFTDIVTSTDLVGLIGDAAWEELLAWHDRTLQRTFAQHGGEVANHTGDGFFVAFDRAGDAIECAVAIQRRLAEHRTQHGFAPWVRIGVHSDEATRLGTDYRGQGVHAAARVGALAGREEIVVSAAALDAAGGPRFPVSERRRAQLKGFAEDFEVATVEWR